MDKNRMMVLNWALICATVVILGAYFLAGVIHDSDNKVRIQQIQQAAK